MKQRQSLYKRQRIQLTRNFIAGMNLPVAKNITLKYIKQNFKK